MSVRVYDLLNTHTHRDTYTYIHFSNRKQEKIKHNQKWTKYYFIFSDNKYYTGCPRSTFSRKWNCSFRNWKPRDIVQNCDNKSN